MNNNKKKVLCSGPHWKRENDRRNKQKYLATKYYFFWL